MSDTALKSFLIKVGFKTDEGSLRRFNETMTSISKSTIQLVKNFAEVGAASIAAGTGIVAGVAKAASAMQSLYFSAQQTGSSVTEIKALGFAFQQIGLSAEQAQTSVEAFAQARRMNPSLNGLLQRYGVDPNLDNADAEFALLSALRQRPHREGAFVAGQFGISEPTFNQVENNGATFAQSFMQGLHLFAGSDENARKATEFTRHLNLLGEKLGQLADRIATRLEPILEPLIDKVSGFVSSLLKLDDQTNGLPTKILGIASALLTFWTTLRLFDRLTGISGAVKGVGGLLRGAGGAAAGAEVAEGAAAGGGLLALAGPLLVPLAIAAATAVVAWLVMHPDLVIHAVKKATAWVKAEAPKAIAAVKAEIPKIIPQAKAVGQKIEQHWIKENPESVAYLRGLAGNVAEWVAGFESHSKTGYGLYRDIAGHLTAGFGHLVRPGEDLSGLDRQGALRLLGTDLKSAMDAVHRLVKVHLTGNQEKALDDLEFNIGETNFAHSTLLKQLNAGHYEAAAEQFQYWNKVLINGHYEVSKGLSNRRAAEAQLFRGNSAPVLNIENKFDITGSDPRSTATEVQRQQDRTNANIVRNLGWVTR